MEKSKLPEFYAIKRDESNPLWGKYIEWIKERSKNNGWITWDYIGFDGSQYRNGYTGSNEVSCFKNPVTIISLEFWNECVNGSDVLQEGDYFNSGPIEEIREIINIVGDKWDEMFKTGICGTLFTNNKTCEFKTKLTFEEFRRRAINTFKPQTMEKEKPPYHPGDEVVLPNTGAAGIVKSCDMYSGEWCVSVCSDSGMHIVSADKVAPFGKVEKENDKWLNSTALKFDPSKPIWVSNDGEEWIPESKAMDENFVFVEITKKGYALFEHKSVGPVVWRHIRNIPEQFSAGMLEVGEWMVTDPGKDGKVNLIRRLKGGFVDVQNPDGDFFFMDVAKEIKGRRVNVEIKTKEI